MKNMLFTAAAVCAVMLPLQKAEAKSYGGFKPGLRFTFVVKDVISSKTQGTKIIKKAPIPKGVPKYRKGQRLNFRILKRGQLKAKGVTLPFKADGGSANIYTLIKRQGLGNKAYTAEIFKTAKNRPSAGAMNFVITKVAGFNTTTSSVNYILKRAKKKKKK